MRAALISAARRGRAVLRAGLSLGANTGRPGALVRGVVVDISDPSRTVDGASISVVEFLGGAERYKVQLTDRLEPLCHGFGVASGARVRAYAAAHLGGIRLRMRLKRSPRLRRLYFDGAAPVRRLTRRAQQEP